LDANLAAERSRVLLRISWRADLVSCLVAVSFRCLGLTVS